MTKYLCTTPILIVNSPQEAKKFYLDKLGFEVSFECGDPLIYLGLKRNEVEIHLNAAANAAHEAGKGSISIFTDEVDELYQNLERNGVEITIAPADREYGLRDFGIRDLDGNIINFGCDVS